MTRKQLELLGFIKDFQEQFGYSPSFGEMQRAAGLNSKSGVFRLLKSLEEQGHVRRLPRRARTVEVIENREERHLSNYATIELAAEAKRRGLVLGHIHRGEDNKRTFKEIAVQVDTMS